MKHMVEEKTRSPPNYTGTALAVGGIGALGYGTYLKTTGNSAMTKHSRKVAQLVKYSEAASKANKFNAKLAASIHKGMDFRSVPIVPGTKLSKEAKYHNKMLVHKGNLVGATSRSKLGKYMMIGGGVAAALGIADKLIKD